MRRRQFLLTWVFLIFYATQNALVYSENSPEPEILTIEEGNEEGNAYDRCKATAIQEKEIIEKIFKDYNRQSRPRKNANVAVNVAVGVSLFGIKEFVERQNLLVLDGYVSLIWKDELLRWNDSFPHNCIPYMYIDADTVWAPSLSFMSGFLDSDPTLYPSKGAKVYVKSDGSMELYPMGKISVQCDLDLSMFPYDEQICSIIVESWSYPNSMQSLSLFTPKNTSAFARTNNIWTESEQWEIVENKSEIVHPVYLENDPQTFDRALFTMKMRRKPMFYRVHVIGPGLIIGIVEVVTFVLPITDVIKIHISFTCLLAYSVFQDSVMQDMPRSQTVPLLSIYINLQMAYIGLIAILGEGLVFLIIRQAQYRNAPNRTVFRVARSIGAVLFFECSSEVSPTSHQHSKEEIANNNNHIPLAERRFADGVDQLPLSAPNGTAVNADHHDTSMSTLKHRQSATVRTSHGDSFNAQHNYDNINSDDEGHYQFTGRNVTSPRGQWLYIAEVVERINMWIYLLAVIITPAVMFTQTTESKSLDSRSHES